MYPLSPAFCVSEQFVLSVSKDMYFEMMTSKYALLVRPHVKMYHHPHCFASHRCVLCQENHVNIYPPPPLCFVIYQTVLLTYTPRESSPNVSPLLCVWHCSSLLSTKSVTSTSTAHPSLPLCCAFSVVCFVSSQRRRDIR